MSYSSSSKTSLNPLKKPSGVLRHGAARLLRMRWGIRRHHQNSLILSARKRAVEGRTHADPTRAEWARLSRERSEYLRKRGVLVAIGRQRHNAGRADPSLAPGLDPLAHPRRRPEQCDIGEPFIGQVARHLVDPAGSECLLDRIHLLGVAG